MFDLIQSFNLVLKILILVSVCIFLGSDEKLLAALYINPSLALESVKWMFILPPLFIFSLFAKYTGSL